MSQKPAYVDTQNFGPDDLFYSDELTMSRPFPLHRHSFAELHYFSGAGAQRTSTESPIRQSREP